MKEYPAPSAQLEDRIMQAIYQTSGSNNVPLSATVLPAAGDIQVQKPNKRRFFVPTWVAAAGVVVAVGLIGAPFLTGNQSEQFAEVATAPASGTQTQSGTTASEAAQPKSPQPLMAPTTAANDAQAGQPAAADQLAQASTGTEAAAANKTAAQAKTGAAAGGDVNAASAKKAVPFLSEQAAGLNAPADEAKLALTAPKTDAPASTAPNAHTTLPARSKTPPTMVNKQAATPPAAASTTAPAIADSNHAIASIQAEGENTAAAFVGPQLPEKQPDSAPAEAGEVTAKQALGPENPITLSTFNDVETAVQASDLPVPTLAKLPPDYALNMLTVQYESQTSKHVTNIQTIYQLANSGKRITIDTTLQQGKRSLSVPGEFSNTQVFQIDGEQAIGVTFKDSAEPSANKSAVYYQAVKGGHSLYIVVTADGIPLNDLMEMTKQITWKTK
ncbi:hypothetical protein ACTID9_19555 [Brevibacillus fluminis]|uniref:hypothetical protein n=1 Tax=Brevibacillus fluminis TaxID=511487 RepID=UPI003F8C3257